MDPHAPGSDTCISTLGAALAHSEAAETAARLTTEHGDEAIIAAQDRLVAAIRERDLASIALLAPVLPILIDAALWAWLRRGGFMSDPDRGRTADSCNDNFEIPGRPDDPRWASAATSGNKPTFAGAAAGGSKGVAMEAGDRDMGSMSIVHWAVVAVAALLLFGTGRISRTMGEVGQGIKALRKGLAEEEPGQVERLPSPAE